MVVCLGRNLARLHLYSIKHKVSMYLGLDFGLIHGSGIIGHLPCDRGRPQRYHSEQETETLSVRWVDI